MKKTNFEGLTPSPSAAKQFLGFRTILKKGIDQDAAEECIKNVKAAKGIAAVSAKWNAEERCLYVVIERLQAETSNDAKRRFAEATGISQCLAVATQAAHFKAEKKVEAKKVEAEVVKTAEVEDKAAHRGFFDCCKEFIKDLFTL